ncbi:hypothetical protein KGQ19_36980 [Catenulispora sp. NL8]|uniref:Uncharacterized protein n=1 Tax=Catenulispora pinistramenti TaxID=2705254 RepID=A0ABS5L2B6_9ACTN|nr:hypothetical protein [Catenulispora pinistramenti]MBS2552463.1 hypothetical protein [Catenulispora pinistramenti]
MVIPSLLYYARSIALMREVAERLGCLPSGAGLGEQVWSKRSDIRRRLDLLAEDEKFEAMGERSLQQVLWQDDECWSREFTAVSGHSVTWLFTQGPVPPFLSAWRDGQTAWPFGGQPFPREFLYTTDPLLRLRALLPDWPAPDYDRERVHLDALEQLESGLILARADRYDLLAQVLRAQGDPLLDRVRPAFEESVRDQSVSALRSALIPERRERNFLFQAYAAPVDPEPDDPAFAVDWDAVRAAAQRDDDELRRHGPTVVGHPLCPPDVRRYAAENWRDGFVWARLLSDRDTGLALLRELPMKSDLSLAVPFGYVGAGGVTVQDVLELAHPADFILRDAAELPGIRRYDPRQCVITKHDTRGAGLLCKGITELADRYLGEDADAWTNGCRLLRDPDFSGSVVDLFQAALSQGPQASYATSSRPTRCAASREAGNASRSRTPR